MLRKGPLIVFGADEGISRAFRNLPGVEVASVDRLNLLQARAAWRRQWQGPLPGWAAQAAGSMPASVQGVCAVLLIRPSPHPPATPQLAPGGHLGRFCVWTQSAFESLDKVRPRGKLDGGSRPGWRCFFLAVAVCALGAPTPAQLLTLRPCSRPPPPPPQVFGTADTPSAQKKGYTLPRPIMTNADVARLINSDEVQSVVRPPKEAVIKSRPLKKNPLKNLGALVKLNPHAAVTRRNAVLAADRRGKVRRRGERGHGGRGARTAARLPAARASAPPTFLKCCSVASRRCRQPPAFRPSPNPANPHTRPPPQPQARAEKLAKLRAGQPSGAAKKSKEQAAVGKAFYKQMIVDSEYAGEDYGEGGGGGGQRAGAEGGCGRARKCRIGQGDRAASAAAAAYPLHPLCRPPTPPAEVFSKWLGSTE